MGYIKKVRNCRVYCYKKQNLLALITASKVLSNQIKYYCDFILQGQLILVENSFFLHGNKSSVNQKYITKQFFSLLEF